MAVHLSAAWIEINPPFKGSLYGVHLGNPWSQAQSELKSRGASAVMESPVSPLLRDVTVTGSRGAETVKSSVVSGNLLSIRVFGATWLILAEGDRKPVTRLTAWNSNYRTAIVSAR